MTTMSMSNPLAGRSLWIVDSRTIVYAAIGAALYGVLGLFDFLLLSIDHLLHFDLLGGLAVQPVDPRHIRAVIQL